MFTARMTFLGMCECIACVWVGGGGGVSVLCAWGGGECIVCVGRG